MGDLHGVLPVPDFDTFWQKGWLEIPPRTQEYVLFTEFRADPENNPLRTPSGRIELYSDEIARFAMMTARRIRRGSNPRSGSATDRRARFRRTLSPVSRATACT